MPFQATSGAARGGEIAPAAVASFHGGGSLRVDLHRVGDQVTCVTPNGELDSSSRRVLRWALDEALRDPACVVVLDLRRLTGIDGSIVGLLLAAHDEARSRGRRLIVIRGRPEVDRASALAGAAEELGRRSAPTGASVASEAWLRQPPLGHPEAMNGHGRNGCAPTRLPLHANRSEVLPTSPADPTNRQLEVLRLIDEGLSTKQIAARLWLSPATVRNHVTGLLRNLEAHTRLEALHRARQRGLI